MWRACNGLLPTKSNLFRRKIVDSNLCPCYSSDSETGFHVLWKCLAAQDVWGGSLVQFQKCSFMGDNFMQLMEYCIERFSSEDLDLMAVIS
jgi:hypothetical protein